MLRKLFENTQEWYAGKLEENWEGPYQVLEVIKPGVYMLIMMKGEVVPRSWNAMSPKKYYY